MGAEEEYQKVGRLTICRDGENAHIIHIMKASKFKFKIISYILLYSRSAIIIF